MTLREFMKMLDEYAQVNPDMLDKPVETSEFGVVNSVAIASKHTETARDFTFIV